MKQNFYKITSSNRFQAVIQFLRKELAWQPTEPLVSATAVAMPMLIAQFTYVNLAFSPAPDDTVSNLFKVCPTCLLSRHASDLAQSFATDGHLIVNYRSVGVCSTWPELTGHSTTAAWG